MLDRIDKSILNILQKDSKTTIKEIAGKLNMTSTPIFERIKRLEKQGIIKNYTVTLDKKELGLSLLVFCNVILQQHKTEYIEQFEKDILTFPEVLSCYHVAGTFDYLLQVCVKDIDAYQGFISKDLSSLENISKIESSFVMSEVVENKVLEIL